MSLTFIDAGKSEKGWSYYGPASHCMRLFSYGYRLGVDLIPGIGLVRGSMGHTMLAHHYAKMGAKQKEGVYVGTAKGVIHVTDPATIMDPFDSLEEWCYRHSKEVDGIGANHDPEDVKQRMRDTFTNYVAREFRPPAKVIGVEVPMKGQLGQRGDQWGLWLMNEGMGELAQDLGEVKPTLLDMPGHDEHGLPIMISRRADAIFADRSGRVDVVDHKCHAHVSVKRARLEYWMGGGWAPFRILARQIWGKKYSGRIMLNLIQTTPPWTVQTTPVPLTPHRDNQFAEQLFRLAHRIAWADVNLDPWSWDMAQNSNACYGPYGLCRAAELCARGPIALRDFNQ